MWGAVTPNEVREAIADLPPLEHGGNNPVVSSSVGEANWGNAEKEDETKQPVDKEPNDEGTESEENNEEEDMKRWDTLKMDDPLTLFYQAQKSNGETPFPESIPSL